MSNGKLKVVVGGQYGSEGKGAVGAFLAADGITATMRVAGPNAGHTAYDSEGREWKLRQVPAAAVTTDTPIFIAAGSEIDWPVLIKEIGELDAAGHAVSGRIAVDPNAVLIEDHHKEAETGLVGRVGSTGKGIGAVRADRAMRTARLVGDLYTDDHGWVYPTAGLMRDWLSTGRDLLIEGTQGYGLGLTAGHYPKCTSSDCRAVDFIAMAGLSPWDTAISRVEVWVVARMYPIRVAGDSGPMIGETTWEGLGLKAETTTVTGKIRRVGAWDPALVARAVEANGGYPAVRLALTMVDQRFPEVTGVEPAAWPDKVHKWLRDHVEWAANAPVGLVGTGPEAYFRYPSGYGI